MTLTPEMTAPLSLDEWRKKHLLEILRSFAGLDIMPTVVAEDILLAADTIERLEAETAEAWAAVRERADQVERLVTQNVHLISENARLEHLLDEANVVYQDPFV